MKQRKVILTPEQEAAAERVLTLAQAAAKEFTDRWLRHTEELRKALGRL